MTTIALQSAVIVACDVLPDRVGALSGALVEIGADPAASRCIPFARLPRTHFARLLVTSAPHRLLYVGDVDGSVEDHLADLVDVAGGGLDAVFGHCAGYPAADRADRDSRLDFLLRRLVRPAAAYVNTIGRTLDQVLVERRLREQVEEFLDGARDRLPDDPLGLRDAVRDFVAGRPDLAPALLPAPSPGAGWWAGQWLRLGLAVLVLLALLPAVVVVGLGYLALLTLQQRREQRLAQPPPPMPLAAPEHLAAVEHRGAQGPFVGLGPLDPGWLPLLSTRVAVAATGFLSRNLFASGSLMGLRTVHFFQLHIDADRRLIFSSTFDGTLESYMDDFIDKLARGLNAIFGGAAGYPRTTLVVLGGARREQEFKEYIAGLKQPVPVFYSAYPDLSVANLANNAAIRAGLSGPMTGDQAAAWLRRL